MGEVTSIKKKEESTCQFCGEEPDHKGFWSCPRLLRVVYYPEDSSWEVEFREPELEIVFEEEESASTQTDGKGKTRGS